MHSWNEQEGRWWEVRGLCSVVTSRLSKDGNRAYNPCNASVELGKGTFEKRKNTVLFTRQIIPDSVQSLRREHQHEQLLDISIMRLSFLQFHGRGCDCSIVTIVFYI
jgi:hypothetical protein